MSLGNDAHGRRCRLVLNVRLHKGRHDRGSRPSKLVHDVDLSLQASRLASQLSFQQLHEPVQSLLLLRQAVFVVTTDSLASFELFGLAWAQVGQLARSDELLLAEDHGWVRGAGRILTGRCLHSLHHTVVHFEGNGNLFVDERVLLLYLRRRLLHFACSSAKTSICTVAFRDDLTNGGAHALAPVVCRLHACHGSRIHGGANLQF